MVWWSSLCSWRNHNIERIEWKGWSRRRRKYYLVFYSIFENLSSFFVFHKIRFFNYWIHRAPKNTHTETRREIERERLWVLNWQSSKRKRWRLHWRSCEVSLCTKTRPRSEEIFGLCQNWTSSLRLLRSAIFFFFFFFFFLSLFVFCLVAEKLTKRKEKFFL